MSGKNTPSLPRIGFDAVVDRIASLYRAHSTAAGAVRAVSKTIRTSFVEAGGKRKAATPIHANPPTVDTPARKHRVVSVTPATSITSAIGRPVLSTPCQFNSFASGAMLINQWGNVIPPHLQHRPSVLQHMYKRMSPDNIVRLSPGDEIIVVLPAVHSRLPTEAIRVIAHYRSLFSRVINLSLPDTVNRADRTNIVTEIIRDNHSFLRADLHFLEFSCRAKSYPIREHLGQESFDEALVHRWCDQGAGIDLSVCGYTASHTVLLQLRFIP